MKRRGFTLVELMVVIAIIALLVGLLLPALGKAIRNARSTRDATQINQILKSFITFAQANKGKFPTPGLINRNLDPHTGQQQPGVGPENKTQNVTKNLYSAMIAQKYFKPEILIGPTEVNAVVVEDKNYNYDMYDPGADKYWDTGFDARIDRPPGTGQECNTSYAHTAICGNRKAQHWRDDNNSSVPNLSTRGCGTGNGTTIVQASSIDYKQSPTLELHGQSRQWVGNIVFNDAHFEVQDNFFPLGVTYEPMNGDEPERDNIFAAEFSDTFANGPQASGDAWLVINLFATSNGLSVTPKWDKLND